MSAVPAANPPPAPSGPIRIMIVDDSVVVRGLTARWLEEAGFEIAATATNGRVALDLVDRVCPDIILLDIEMPEMDGLEALPLLLAKRPGASVVAISTLTKRNAQISLKCLSLGAIEYLAKPDGHRGVSTSLAFREELIAKVQGLVPRHRRGAGDARRIAREARAPEPSAAPRVHADSRSLEAARKPIEAPRLASRPRLVAPRCLLIGASTGGPRAVAEVLSALAPALRNVPICIVQHMPPIFTTVFAEHLATQTGLITTEGRDGIRLEPGCVYVAPGGRHMGLRREGPGTVSIRLEDGPAVNFCKPAVDVLFHDAAGVFGASALAVVLTGMGSDGTAGARALAQAGATILVQDEATSTVWGMPGSIAKAGLAHDILPLAGIAPATRNLLIGGAA